MPTQPTRLIPVPGLPGATLLEHRGRTTARSRHVHDSLVLGLVLEGRRVLEVGGSALVLEAGQGYVLPPGLAHACHDETEVRALCVCIGPATPVHRPRETLPQEVRLVMDLLVQSPERGCADLARQAGISPWRLSRLFRRGLGLTVPDFRAHLRLKRAKKLLARGVNPAYAALEAGFFDQSHLNREFRRRVGMTPTAYARGLRGTGETP